MRIKSRFVVITGGFFIAVVFYQIGRTRQLDNTKKFYLDGSNPDSGEFQILNTSNLTFYLFRLFGSRERSF